MRFIDVMHLGADDTEPCFKIEVKGIIGWMWLAPENLLKLKNKHLILSSR